MYCEKCGKVQKIEPQKIKDLIRKFENMGYRELSTEITGDPNHRVISFMTSRRAGYAIFDIRMNLKRVFGDAVKNIEFKNKKDGSSNNFEVVLKW